MTYKYHWMLEVLVVLSMSLFTIQDIQAQSLGTVSLLGQADTPGAGASVVVNGQYTYIGDGTAGVQVIDTSDTSSSFITDCNVQHTDTFGSRGRRRVITENFNL